MGDRETRYRCATRGALGSRAGRGPAQGDRAATGRRAPVGRPPSLWSSPSCAPRPSASCCAGRADDGERGYGLLEAAPRITLSVYDVALAGVVRQPTDGGADRAPHGAARAPVGAVLAGGPRAARRPRPGVLRAGSDRRSAIARGAREAKASLADGGAGARSAWRRCARRASGGARAYPTFRVELDAVVGGRTQAAGARTAALPVEGRHLPVPTKVSRHRCWRRPRGGGRIKVESAVTDTREAASSARAFR